VRPVVATASDPLVTGTALAVTGTAFTGLGEGSTGLGDMHSATNYPLVQLRRLDNDEVRWLPVDPAVGWSGASFRSLALNGWFPGPAIATVFTSGIPSVSKAVTVECPPAVITTQPVGQNLCALDPATLTAAVSTSFCETYQWYKDGAPIPESPPFSGTQTSMLTMSAATPGTYRVDVTLACNSAVTSSANAVLAVDPPLSVVNATMRAGRRCAGRASAARPPRATWAEGPSASSGATARRAAGSCSA